MFIKGKTYRTVLGYPATVIWVNPKSGMLAAVHYRYTDSECVLFHHPCGAASLVQVSKDDANEAVIDIVSNILNINQHLDSYMSESALTNIFYA
jgi:hypothetical protein